MTRRNGSGDTIATYSAASPRIKTEADNDPHSTRLDFETSTALPLPLDLERKASEPIAKKRSAPCDGCRRVRRACKWLGGFEVCERCWKSGRVCSGPSRWVTAASTAQDISTPADIRAVERRDRRLLTCFLPFSNELVEWPRSVLRLLRRDGRRCTCLIRSLITWSSVRTTQQNSTAREMLIAALPHSWLEKP